MGAVLVLVVACTGDDHDIDTVAIDPDVTAIDLPGERASTAAGVEDPDSSAARLLEASLCERLISDDDVLDAFGSVPQAPPAATVELDDALAFVTCSWTVADPIHTIVLHVEVARDDVTRSLFASGRADPGEEHVLAWQCRSPGRPYGRLRLRRLLLLRRRLLLWLRRQQR